MNIIFKSAFLINREEKQAERKEIDESAKGFGNYVQRLVNKIETHSKTRAFKIRRRTSEVISNVYKIANKTINGDLDCHDYCKAIADKFVDCEVHAQEKNHMVDMQNGSLVIVVFESEENFSLLIAKVAHNIFVAEDDYSTRNGFEIDNVSHWKTCIFDLIESEGNWEIEGISVFINHAASYWHDSFLDLDELNTNENNTKIVFDEVMKIITNSTKESPCDRFDLKNSLIGYMKQDRLFNYPDLVNHLVHNYDSSYLGQEKIKKMEENLIRLGETNKFDKQFRTVPAMIKSRVRTSKFNINANVELLIKDYVEKKEDIKAYEKSGKWYLVIRTNDDNTYNTFKTKDTLDDIYR